jgi:hypothetical protein
MKKATQLLERLRNATGPKCFHCGRLASRIFELRGSTGLCYVCDSCPGPPAPPVWKARDIPNAGLLREVDAFIAKKRRELKPVGAERGEDYVGDPTHRRGSKSARDGLSP